MFGKNNRKDEEGVIVCLKLAVERMEYSLAIW